MGKLYTIGHSQHEFQYFLHLLQKHKINYLLDVRSTPFSKFAQIYNKDTLKYLLSNNNISYWAMGKFFGARPKDRSLYSDSGYLDFEKVKKSELFLRGKDNVKLGLQRGNQIALMCTEKDPIDCHRAIMVAKAFFDDGIEVYHILPNGELQTHTELEKRLLNMYFPRDNQISIFRFMTTYEFTGFIHDSDLFNKSNYNRFDDNKRLLQEAYAKRNEEIGYRYAKEDNV